MRWASALSLKIHADLAAQECLEALRRDLSESTPHLILAFPAGQHAAHPEGLHSALRDAHPDAVLVGCGAGGVIGGGHEAEGMTALSVTAAVLPDVEIRPVRIEPETIPGLDVSPAVWRNVVGVDGSGAGWSFVLLADPFTSRVEELLQGLDYAYPDAPKIGGLASASQSPGGNSLFLNEGRFRDGAVGVALSGNCRMDTVVAQGGRPVGRELSVTKCTRNVLFELDQRPALEVFQEIYQEVAETFPEGKAPAFFVGIRSHEADGPGDFLIRNILGVDPNVGAIAVGSLLRDGQAVRFHLLTRDTAREDLRCLLEKYRERSEADRASGALLFSCNGRGQNLFNEPDHDTNLFHEVLRPDVPLGGLFCAGEIGPLGPNTYLHGFTSSFGILRPLRPES